MSKLGGTTDELTSAGPAAQPEAVASPADWIACWEQLEVLARDAARFYDKCGEHCDLESLAEWRERIRASVEATLAEEQQVFQRLREAAES